MIRLKFRLFFLLRKWDYAKIYRLNSKDEYGAYFINQVLVNSKGQTHEDAIEISQFDNGSAKFKELENILYQSVKYQIIAACLPIYRDSIVFYSKDHKVKGVLNICFQCLYLCNEKGGDMKPDVETFNKLFEFVGHDISRLSE